MSKISSVFIIFGETIKQYLNYVIIAVTIVLIAFFCIIYKKRHSIIDNKNSNIPELDSIKTTERENTEQTICQ